MTIPAAGSHAAQPGVMEDLDEMNYIWLMWTAPSVRMRRDRKNRNATGR
jgi:hypothetical protein